MPACLRLDGHRRGIWPREARSVAVKDEAGQKIPETGCGLAYRAAAVEVVLERSFGWLGARRSGEPSGEPIPRREDASFLRLPALPPAWVRKSSSCLTLFSPGTWSSTGGGQKSAPP